MRVPVCVCVCKRQNNCRMNSHTKKKNCNEFCRLQPKAVSVASANVNVNIDAAAAAAVAVAAYAAAYALCDLLLFHRSKLYCVFVSGL